MSETLTAPGSSTPDSGPAASQVPLERLEAQICELAGHLTAATCRFLVMVGDFDARRGWESWDLPSCSAWLSWKCQLSLGTAREQVRVARALRDLPVIRGQFAAGRLSYAKVRALTRIATPATDADLAELAIPMTGAQLDRFARAHRQVSRADDQQARAARRVTWRVDDHDGSLAMTVRLPAAPGQVLIQALRAAAHDLDHPHHPSDGDSSSGSADPPTSHSRASAEASTTATTHHARDESAAAQPGEPASPGDSRASAEAPAPPDSTAEEAARPGAQSLADALTSIAADYLAGKITAADNPDLYQVIVHVGPEALSDDDDLAPAAPAPAEAPAPAQPPATPAPPATDPEDACRPDCPYRRVGHPAHPQRCHLEDGPALSHAAAQQIACTATISWML
ncbi:MAG TPA: hypothetical protein VHU92_06495, partial [Streptosporangiaceae bacterium]|nr:hypothetical protein [Streptosporangiaceae bacterium]